MASYSGVTLSELKTRLISKLGGNSTFWVDQELNDAINEALCLWQVMAGEFTTTFVRPALSVPFYDVPRQIISLYRVKWNSTPLVNTSLFELDNGFPGWQVAAGTPRFWAPIGLNKVAIYPAPTSGTITFEGLMENFRLLTDGDFLELGEEQIVPILNYARHYCTFKEGGVEMESSANALVELVIAAGQWNGRIRETSFYRSALGTKVSGENAGVQY